MSAELFAVGLEFAEGGFGFLLIAAVLVVVALIALAFWLVLRPDPPERDRANDQSGDGW